MNEYEDIMYFLENALVLETGYRLDDILIYQTANSDYKTKGKTNPLSLSGFAWNDKEDKHLFVNLPGKFKANIRLVARKIK